MAYNHCVHAELYAMYGGKCYIIRIEWGANGEKTLRTIQKDYQKEWLSAFQAHLKQKDRSPLTISGYIHDITGLRENGVIINNDTLSHVSPLPSAHIIPTGTYNFAA